MNEIPISLYIHMPWCVRKCPYCDFNSYALPQHFPEDSYIDALIKDFVHKTNCSNPTIFSIFIGGGTPSLFAARSIDKLLNSITKHASFKSSIEISMEINPGTCNQAKLTDFRATGINRLSIGVQSFQDDKLKALGRIHNKETAIEIITMAQQAQFTNFNLDLMHGLPAQTCKDALSDLRTAISLQPTHISWYQLTIEENTPFGQEPPILPDEETTLAMQQQGVELLAENNYTRYEISNYCQPDFACQHNLNYWQFGDYIGIGAGAHGKTTNQKTGIITRYYCNPEPTEYIRNCQNTTSPCPHHSPIDNIKLEFMLNALRLTNGVPIELFEQRTGLKLASIKPQLRQAIDQGFIENRTDRIQPTTHGQQFLNQCLTIFCE